MDVDGEKVYWLTQTDKSIGPGEEKPVGRSVNTNPQL